MEYKWTALTVTTVGTFMASLDTSIVVIPMQIEIQIPLDTDFRRYGILFEPNAKVLNK